MANAKKDTAAAVPTPALAAKVERPAWKAPILIENSETGLTNVSQELLDGPSKGKSTGLHAAALIEALKKVTEERDEQYAQVQQLKQQLEGLRDQLKSSRGVNQQHQARTSALHAGLDVVRDLMQLLGVGKFSHEWYDGVLTLRWISGGLVYTAELQPSQSQIGEFERAAFSVASDEGAAICIIPQGPDLSDTGQLNNAAASAIRAAIDNSDPGTFQRNLTELPASVFTDTYSQQHHSLMQVIRAADAQGSPELVRSLLHCYTLPLYLLESAIARAQHRQRP